MMTLDEAIKHCKDVALSCTNKECALEHFQLLKWLQEYSNMLEKQGEQKTTIEMKTPEESLGIDSDTYNKIVDECIYGEQKPAWSEEDEKMFEHIIAKATLHFSSINYLDEEEINFLKSLKDRVQTQQKQEWSEEDERLRTSCIKHIEEELEMIRNDKYGHSEIISDLKESCRERINWLKSLKPQKQWKPSDEQIMALRWVLSHIPYDFHKEEINGLLEQLKKLREE